MNASFIVWTLTLSIGAAGFFCTVGALCLLSMLIKQFSAWLNERREMAEIDAYWKARRR